MALDFMHRECQLIHAVIKADSIMFGIQDDSIFEVFEQAELNHPCPRKDVGGSRFIYATRRLTVPDASCETSSFRATRATLTRVSKMTCCHPGARSRWSRLFFPRCCLLPRQEGRALWGLWMQKDYKALPRLSDAQSVRYVRSTAHALFSTPALPLSQRASQFSLSSSRKTFSPYDTANSSPTDVNFRHRDETSSSTGRQRN